MVPNAAEWRTSYHKAKALFVRAKSLKDVESEDGEKKHFEAYEVALNTVQDLREQVEPLLPDMFAFDRTKKRKEWRSYLIPFALGIVLTLLGVGAGFFLPRLFQ